MTFINCDPPAYIPPYEEWKYYIRKKDYSVHLSPFPVEGAQEVEPPPPPQDDYIWDWKENKWAYHLEYFKRIAIQKVEAEFKRLEKFKMLDNPATEIILKYYTDSLRAYIRDFSQQSVFPTVPPSLTDESFYSK